MLRCFWNLAVIDSFVQRKFYSEDTFVDSLLNLSSSYFMCVLFFFHSKYLMIQIPSISSS
jgi:hypothetical protein